MMYILTLEKVGATLNYLKIFITLAQHAKNYRSILALQKEGTTVNYCGIL